MIPPKSQSRLLYSVVILLNDGGDYKTVNLDEVLQLVDSLIGQQVYFPLRSFNDGKIKKASARHWTDYIFPLVEVERKLSRLKKAA